MASRFGTVDEYIEALPEDVQLIVQRIRATIRDVVPGVGEKISYAMPTFTLDGLPLVHVAAWKKTSPCTPCLGWRALADEVAPYRGAKDAMHQRCASRSRTSWSGEWSRRWSNAEPTVGEEFPGRRPRRWWSAVSPCRQADSPREPGERHPRASLGRS